MKASKSAIFLFELMIVILVFTIAAAVCVKIFVSAYSMSEESRALTMSATIAASAADVFKASNGGDDEASYFDEDWNPVMDEADAYYSVEIEDAGRTDQLLSATVNVYARGEGAPIYTLDVEKYVG